MFAKKSGSEAAKKDEEKAPAMDAMALLRKDHRTVSALFKQLEDTEDDAEKVALAQQICTELTIHAEAEERVFYPAARRALREDDEDLVDEAAVEHRSLKMLIAEIDGSSPSDALFDASLEVLKEYVEHHVKEEENEMFPKLERSDAFEKDAVGAKLAEVKEQLQSAAARSKPSRAGAKPRVRVPDLSGPMRTRTRTKTAKSQPRAHAPRTARAPKRKPKARSSRKKTASRARG